MARSIDDATAILKRTPVMVPDFYLVGDGKTGESAVVVGSGTITATGLLGASGLLAWNSISAARSGTSLAISCRKVAA